jgi:hypothetical protein
MAQTVNEPYDRILDAMIYAFFFRATDEKGNVLSSDVVFDDYTARGFSVTLREICGIDTEKEAALFNMALTSFKTLKAREEGYLDEMVNTLPLSSN